MTMDRMTITLPEEDAARLRELREAGRISSVSDFVAEVVHAKLSVESAIARMEARFGPTPPEAVAQARALMAGESA